MEQGDAGHGTELGHAVSSRHVRVGAKAGHEREGGKGGEALARPPVGQAREGLGQFSSWAGKEEEEFFKENPFLLLFFKSKPNSNEI